MDRLVFLLCLLSLLTGRQGYGQDVVQSSGTVIDVYPVRVNHKFGFVKFYQFGNTVITDTLVAPRYDYIGDVNLPWNTAGRQSDKSPFRLFELDEKVGLLDPFLKEALPNHYKRIRPLSERYFAVERDSLFLLLDHKQNKILFDSIRYDDIRLADTLENGTAYFFVKKGIQWGIRSSEGKELAKPLYLDIRQAGCRGYYKVRPDQKTGWLLIDVRAKRVLEKRYADVMAVGPDLVAFLENGRWQLLGREKDNKDKGFKAIGAFMETLEKVNDSLLIAVTVKPLTIELWSIARQEQITSYNDVSPAGKEKRPVDDESGRENPYYPWVFPLDSLYVTFCAGYTGNGYKDRLMDFKGDYQSPTYTAIHPTGKVGFYKANLFGNWGLLMPSNGSGLLLPFEYSEISDFNGSFLLMKSKGAYGVLAAKGYRLDTLPCVYDNISFVPGKDSVYVHLSGQTILYSLDDNVRFKSEGIFDNLSIIAQNSAAIKEAVTIEKNRAGQYRGDTGIQGELVTVVKDNAIVVEKRIRVQREFGGYDTETKWSASIPLNNKPAWLMEIKEDKIIAFHKHGTSISNPLISSFYEAPVEEIVFFDVEQGTLVSTPKIIGIRPFDKHYKYTTFIAEDGQMGLIDRDGNECTVDGKSLRYAFIGPFVAGRARVCRNAQLALVGPDRDLNLPYKYRINSPAFFKPEFNLRFNVERQKEEHSKPGLIFAIAKTNDRPCSWGYVDEGGALIIQTSAGYVKDFGADSTALILRANKRNDAYGRPDADYGALNWDGTEILKTDFSQIIRLENYFQVSVDSTPTFFFTQRGHEIFINPTRLRPFSEGIAQFKDDHGYWGYVDTAGQILIPPQFAQARPFSDGMALVADTSGQCLYINSQGEIAFRTDFNVKQWRGIGDFHNGLAWYKGLGWSWGAYNKYGQTIIPASYYYQIKGEELPKLDEPYALPMDFVKGVAAVAKMDERGNAYAAIIDTSGALIFEDKNIRHISSFNAIGLATYTAKSNKLKGLINAQGEIVMEAAYVAIGNFEDGIAKIQSESGKWGLINHKGNLKVKPAYAFLGKPSEGLVAVKSSKYSGWGYLDYEGNIRIKGPYRSATPFKGGVAFVSTDEEQMIITKAGLRVTTEQGHPAFFAEGLFGMESKRKKQQSFYADASGNNVFGRFFEEITPFQLGVAKVRRLSEQEGRRELLGAINRRGVMVVPPKYRMLHIQPDGNIIINPQRYYGIATRLGNIIIEPEYDRIEVFDEEGLYRIERGEKIGYVVIKNGESREVWPLQY